MGTRFMSAAESPAHQRWKQAIADTDITLNIAQAHPEVTMRVVRTQLAEAVQRGDVALDGNPYAGPFMEAFENGRIDLAMVGAGESATLVQGIKPVAEIIGDTVAGFWREIERLAALLQPAAVQ
jgi:enoyl-[acyl-carrier protein] reductase II